MALLISVLPLTFTHSSRVVRLYAQLRVRSVRLRPHIRRQVSCCCLLAWSPTFAAPLASVCPSFLVTEACHIVLRVLSFMAFCVLSSLPALTPQLLLAAFASCCSYVIIAAAGAVVLALVVGVACCCVRKSDACSCSVRVSFSLSARSHSLLLPPRAALLGCRRLFLRLLRLPQLLYLPLCSREMGALRAATLNRSCRLLLWVCCPVLQARAQVGRPGDRQGL